MHCLKCGKETAQQQVFCGECLDIMQQYPVKPGTAVQLPQRDHPTQEKKPSVRHQEPSLAEQVDRLRLVLRWLTATIAVLSVLLLLTGAMLIHTLTKQDTPSAIGRNYTTSTSGNQP